MGDCPEEVVRMFHSDHTLMVTSVYVKGSGLIQATALTNKGRQTQVKLEVGRALEEKFFEEVVITCGH